MENMLSYWQQPKTIFFKSFLVVFLFFLISFLLSSICNEIDMNTSVIAQLFLQSAVNLNAVTAGGRCPDKHSDCF